MYALWHCVLEIHNLLLLLYGVTEKRLSWVSEKTLDFGILNSTETNKNCREFKVLKNALYIVERPLVCVSHKVNCWLNKNVLHRFIYLKTWSLVCSVASGDYIIFNRFSFPGGSMSLRLVVIFYITLI